MTKKYTILVAAFICVVVAALIFLVPMISPFKRANITPATIILGLLTFLVCDWIVLKFTSHPSQAQIITPKTKENELEKKNLELKEKVKSLQKQISKETHIKNLHDKYTFDNETGISTDNTGWKHVCSLCLKKGEENELVNKDFVWYCIHCNTPFEKPNVPPPHIEPNNYGLD